MLAGPIYETRAELRMLRALGGDAVGHVHRARGDRRAPRGRAGARLQPDHQQGDAREWRARRTRRSSRWAAIGAAAPRHPARRAAAGGSPMLFGRLSTAALIAGHRGGAGRRHHLPRVQPRVRRRPAGRPPAAGPGRVSSTRCATSTRSARSCFLSPASAGASRCRSTPYALRPGRIGMAYVALAGTDRELRGRRGFAVVFRVLRAGRRAGRLPARGRCARSSCFNLAPRHLQPDPDPAARWLQRRPRRSSRRAGDDRAALRAVRRHRAPAPAGPRPTARQPARLALRRWPRPAHREVADSVHRVAQFVAPPHGARRARRRRRCAARLLPGRGAAALRRHAGRRPAPRARRRWPARRGRPATIRTCWPPRCSTTRPRAIACASGTGSPASCWRRSRRARWRRLAVPIRRRGATRSTSTCTTRRSRPSGAGAGLRAAASPPSSAAQPTGPMRSWQRALRRADDAC